MAKTTSNSEGLSERIEQLVREHIAESRRSAQEAVERGFAVAETRAARARKSSTGSRGRTGRRRPPEEVTAIGQRLYAAICASPGKGMAALAEEVGISVRELHRPMTRLRSAGQIRSVGSKHLTRYFPMAVDAAADTE